MKTVKYVGFYTEDKNGYARNGSIAATNKMNYICDVINVLGYKVEIICPSWFTSDDRNYSKQYKVYINALTTIVFAPSFRASTKLTRYIRTIVSKVWLFLYLVKHTHTEEEIIVYHSLALIIPILAAKKIKKLHLILETNEVYCDVMKFPNYIRMLEEKLIRAADKYIFSTELLNKKFNVDNKPFVINYGTYKIQKDRAQKFVDGKIHLVYAGIIDNQKGGATAAVGAAEYLNNKYHIHIIGFGNEECLERLQFLISEVSRKTDCVITYDGFIKGEDYINFLQKCDIGLSTQKPFGTFNETSFPSKILSYLSNGLRVVSIRLNTIEQSSISDLIYFYDQNLPKEIANTIQKVDLSEFYDSRERIKIMHRLFAEEIKRLICS